MCYLAFEDLTFEDFDRNDKDFNCMQHILIKDDYFFSKNYFDAVQWSQQIDAIRLC